MKIEYLSEGAQECPLIRIYGSNYQEFMRLSTAISNLISSRKEVFLGDRTGFETGDLVGRGTG